MPKILALCPPVKSGDPFIPIGVLRLDKQRANTFLGGYMARKRMIDPSIWTNEKFGTLSTLAQVLFIGMISNADDEGRLKASSKYIKAVILPYSEHPYDTLTIPLRDLYDTGMVVPYTVDNIEYAYFPKSHIYQ